MADKVSRKHNDFYFLLIFSSENLRAQLCQESEKPIFSQNLQTPA